MSTFRRRSSRSLRASSPRSTAAEGAAAPTASGSSAAPGSTAGEGVPASAGSPAPGSSAAEGAAGSAASGPAAAELEALRQQVAALQATVAGRRPEPCYVGDRVALAPTHFDRWIYLDTDDRSVCPHILTTGTWEPGTTRFFQTYVPDGGRYVEVGANYGYYALQAACLVGDQGSVVAYEPVPRIFELLQRTVDVNGIAGRTTLERVAIADRVGTAPLYLKGDWHGGSGLYRPPGQVPFEITEVEVPVTTLDRALGPEPVDFLKIDAEGAEAEVLDGAARILDASEDLVILIEISVRGWVSLVEDAEKLLRGLEGRGFRFWLIAEDGHGVPSGVEDILAAAVVARDVCCARRPPTPRPGFPPLL